jgi:hypothetical protein
MGVIASIIPRPAAGPLASLLSGGPSAAERTCREMAPR